MDDLSGVIERAREHGATVHDLADAFGVTLPTARRLVNGVGG